ncbi:hypothetical protein JZO70_07330 [Enterococcus sp. 669A]|uniref:Uncharacterized protein n=1 Tax=Candidatus Enterococcus moelleringii TaxID=2815325 RepID=A0ABS3L8K8_9ENTE|nr:hypothetical protein [Enterococcus sp. 669A]MBO1305966.1 hypothetical protein [Enterococcus sp. 669A]
MYPFLSNRLDFAILMGITYCIYKTETSGTQKEKEINRNALALTASTMIFLWLLDAGAQLLHSIAGFSGFFSKIRAIGEGLSLDVVLLLIVYLFSCSFYQKPVAEREKLMGSFKFKGTK